MWETVWKRCGSVEFIIIPTKIMGLESQGMLLAADFNN